MGFKDEYFFLLEIMNFYEVSLEFLEFSRVYFVDFKTLLLWKVLLFVFVKIFEVFER